MKKFSFRIATLGCKVNQYESDGIAAALEAQGLVKIKQGVADLCIINTCAVTSKAGMQSRQAIRKLIRDNPGGKIIVTGCHAQTDPETIRQIPEVDHLVCNKDKVIIAEKIADLLGESFKDRTAPQVIGKNPGEDSNKGILAEPFEFALANHTSSNRFHSFDKPVAGDMTRAYLKIQDGCNSFCTYCIVPYARGSSVSMPEDQVINHIEGLASQGFKEVIITGIHTGLYGRDLDPGTSLLALLEKIDRLRPLERIRISSIEPGEICEGIMDLAKPGRILCDHFHIPLQSGDDDILKKMKRPYSAGFFEEQVIKIHEKLPFAGIGLDTLVGFPSETEKQFENTYRLVEKLPISYLHVFPFSPRKGTPAFHFDNKVTESVIRERCARLRELDQKKRKGFIRANAKRRLKGLVQNKKDHKTGMLKAITANYLTVFLEKKEGLKGKIVDLNYEQCDSGVNLIGKILEE